MIGTNSSPAVSLSIGLLAKRAHCSIETIRYYERIGLMPAPPRTPGGRRIYAHSHLRHLTFVRRARALGFSLEEIRGLARLVEGEHYTCEEVKTITLDHLAEIKSRISDLKRLAKALEQMAAECAGGTVPECAIVDALRRPG